MEQRDINSRTRADTFGLRPDIYDALAGNMVKKDDLGIAAGTSGYGKFSTGPVSFNLASGKPFGDPVVAETSDLKFVHFGPCGWETVNGVNIPLAGAVLEHPGIWACIPYFKFNMDGAGDVGAQVGLAQNINSQESGSSSNVRDEANFIYRGAQNNIDIGLSTFHTIIVTQDDVDSGAGIYGVCRPSGRDITITNASITVFRLDSDRVI